MDTTDSAEVKTLRKIGQAIRGREFAGSRRRLTRIYRALSIAMGYSEWIDVCRDHPATLRGRMARLTTSYHGFPVSVGHVSQSLRIDVESAAAILRDLVEPAIVEFESRRNGMPR